ncbi:MAG TPA: alpha/beta fold hydrolase [Azospirillaceae bacterium]|nr:alpha/beta fold hydrolase [Azospirillaceae bacterium]
MSGLMIGEEGLLRVDDRHAVYWARWGGAGGVPLLLLPSGPGAGHDDAVRGIFDPARFDITLIEPRGCGRSLPPGETEANTTAHLVEDIERLRRHLGIDRWIILGRLWGAALALAYAQAHPGRCAGLVATAVYLGDSADVAWFFGGASCMITQAWEDAVAFLPAEYRHDPLEGYWRLVTDPDPVVAARAAAAFMEYDRAIVRHRPGGLVTNDGDETDAENVQFCRLFLHYLRNGFFLGDGVLLAGLDRIRHIPAEIVQGRFDLASGMRPAWRLAKSWPEARFTVVDGAGSGYFRDPMRAEILGAVDRLAARY